MWQNPISKSKYKEIFMHTVQFSCVKGQSLRSVPFSTYKSLVEISAHEKRTKEWGRHEKGTQKGQEPHKRKQSASTEAVREVTHADAALPLPPEACHFLEFLQVGDPQWAFLIPHLCPLVHQQLSGVRRFSLAVLLPHKDQTASEVPPLLQFPRAQQHSRH